MAARGAVGCGADCGLWGAARGAVMPKRVVRSDPGIHVERDLAMAITTHASLLLV